MCIPTDDSGIPPKFNASPIGGEELLEKEPMQVANSLSPQNVFLQKVLGGEERIRFAISHLRNDRLSNSAQLTKFLKESISVLPKVNEELIQEDPLLSMLVLILNNDPSENHLREIAAETYIAKHSEDKRFEKAYAYLKVPHILVAHLLISTNQWKCANSENDEFYDEQMAGLFHGTVAFDKGDRLSPEELNKIKKQEGEKPRFPIAKKLEEKEGYFEVKDWCSTPPMCPSDTRLDDLFIDSRRVKQERVVVDYINSLKETSSIILATYGLPPNKSAVVAIIGPYGVGKSRFTQQKFTEAKKVTTFDLDKLNSFLMESTSRPQDHHFEAMMLKSKLLSSLAEVPALLTETAAIDEYRFNRMVNRDFSSRDQIIVEEIAPEKPSDAVNRFISREGVTDQSRLGAATTSANDALKFRSGRIEMTKENSKINFTLYCSQPDKERNAVFIEVAKVQDGKVLVAEGQEELFKRLTT